MVTLLSIANPAVLVHMAVLLTLESGASKAPKRVDMAITQVLTETSRLQGREYSRARIAL